MKNIVSVLLLFCSYNIYSQNPDALSVTIKEVKKGVLPIFCHDSTWTNQVFQSGTCVALGNMTKMCFLTCEHVVAIKDSLRKTKRYVSDFYIQVGNDRDSTFETIKVKLIYTDEKRDFALLVPDENQKIKTFPYIHTLPQNLLQGTAALNEGQNVLYMGYPVINRRDKVNHTVSKTGIISQLVHQENSFLIDGYMQTKHSGSAVFALQKDSVISNHWNYFLIGIASTFPAEFGHVYENLNSDELQYKWTLLNPGYTNVISMNEIIPVLKSLNF